MTQINHENTDITPTSSPNRTDYPQVQRRNVHTKNIIAHKVQRTLESGEPSNINDRLELLKNQCEEYRSQLQKLSEENFELKKSEQKYAFLNSQQNDSIEKEINAQLVDSINNLANEKNSLDKKISKLNSEIYSLKAGINSQKAANDQISKLLSDQSLEFFEFKQKAEESHHNMTQELKNKSVELEELKLEIFDNDRNLKFLKSQIEENETKINQLIADNKTLLDENQELYLKLENNAKIMDSSKQAVEEIINENRALKVSYNELIDKHESMCHENFENYTKFKEEISRLNSKIRDFKNENEDLKRLNSSLNAQISSISSEDNAKTLMDELNSSQKLIEKLKNEIIDLQNSQSFKESLIEDLNEKLSSISSENIEILERCEKDVQTEKFYNTFTGNTELLQTDLVDETEKLRERISELQKEVEFLKINGASDTAKDFELSKFKQENDFLKAFKASSEKEIDILNESLRQSQQSISYEKNKYSVLREKNRQQRKSFKSSEKLASKLKDIEQLNVEIDQKNQDLATLNSHLTEQLNTLQSSLSFYEAENNKLQQKIDNNPVSSTNNNDESLIKLYKDELLKNSYEIKNLNERIQSLSNENMQLASNVSFKNSEIENLKNEIFSLNLNIARLNSEINDKHRTVSSLKDHESSPVHTLKVESVDGEIKNLILSIAAKVSENSLANQKILSTLEQKSIQDSIIKSEIDSIKNSLINQHNKYTNSINDESVKIIDNINNRLTNSTREVNSKLDYIYQTVSQLENNTNTKQESDSQNIINNLKTLSESFSRITRNFDNKFEQLNDRIERNRPEPPVTIDHAVKKIDELILETNKHSRIFENIVNQRVTKAIDSITEANRNNTSVSNQKMDTIQEKLDSIIRNNNVTNSYITQTKVSQTREALPQKIKIPDEAVASLKKSLIQVKKPVSIESIRRKAEHVNASHFD